jgi:oligosaccharyltransferase complex subunit beta
VALVQGRNNARATVIGSLDMLSNAFFGAEVGNAPFVTDIAEWTFHQRGVLRPSNLRHRVIGGDVSPAVYRIKDEVEFAVDIEECGRGGCGPYRADDVQVEFVMLDPYVRRTLTDTGNVSFVCCPCYVLWMNAA